MKEEAVKIKKKRGGDNGKRKPITDDLGTWCNCTKPNLVSPYHGKGTASCLKCGYPWYN